MKRFRQRGRSKTLRIFICYRRGDSPGEAGRLADTLHAEFVTDVFLDIDTIVPGEPFEDAIGKAVATSDVMLVIIGLNWLTAAGPGGERRIDDPDDFVRIEIKRALDRNMRVIPVLVQDAQMPRPEELPEELRSLAFRQAIDLRLSTWTEDVQRLVEALEVLPAREIVEPEARREVERRAEAVQQVSKDSHAAVFISHAEEDYRTAEQIAAGLETAGVSTWLFERDSLPGPSYIIQTAVAIKSSQAVLVLSLIHI